MAIYRLTTKRKCHFQVMRGQVRRSPLSPVLTVPLKGLSRALVSQMECHIHWTVMLNYRSCGDSSVTGLLLHKSVKAIDFRGAPFSNHISRLPCILTAGHGDKNCLCNRMISLDPLCFFSLSNIEPHVGNTGAFRHLCLSWELRIEAVNGH